MKIKISNYQSRLMSMFHTRYMNKKYGYVDWPEEQTRFERSLEWLEDRVQDFYDVFNWIWFDRRTGQKQTIHIDRWDTWSMDHTLAPIILPMLIQLKKEKHGAPNVDPQDVPKNLRVSSQDYHRYKRTGETDPKFFERWDWVLDEMIYAFDCKANKDDVWMRFDFKTEQEAMDAEQDRISNGFRLFGKYYENLWD